MHQLHAVLQASSTSIHLLCVCRYGATAGFDANGAYMAGAMYNMPTYGTEVGSTLVLLISSLVRCMHQTGWSDLLTVYVPAVLVPSSVPPAGASWQWQCTCWSHVPDAAPGRRHLGSQRGLPPAPTSTAPLRPAGHTTHGQWGRLWQAELSPQW
jgi:hypothetical protein